MKKITLRIGCFVLAMITALVVVKVPAEAKSKSLTEAEVTAAVEAYISKTGIKTTKKYWSMDQSKNTLIKQVKKGDYTSCLANSAGGTSNHFNGKECNGFCRYMRYVVFGETDSWGSEYKKASLSKSCCLKCGDIIRINGSGTGTHWVFVYKIKYDGNNSNNDVIYFIEANYGGYCHVNLRNMTRDALWKILYSVWGCAPTNIGTVTYNANGGTGTMSAKKVGGNSKTISRGIKLPDCTFTNGKKIFLGWDTNPKAKLPSYKAGSTYRVTGDTTLYAIWGGAVESAIVQCATTDTYLTLKLAGNKVLYNVPGTTSTYPVSKKLTKIAKGTQLTCTQLYKNSAGNYWYKVTTSAGKEGFISSSNVVASIPKDAAYMKSGWTPGTCTVGKAKALKDTILTRNCIITKVAGRITDSKGNSYSKSQSGLSVKSYNMNGSVIDKGLTFAKLKAGTCTYKIAVVVKTPAINNSKLTDITASITVRECKFTEKK